MFDLLFYAVTFVACKSSTEKDKCINEVKKRNYKIISDMQRSKYITLSTIDKMNKTKKMKNVKVNENKFVDDVNKYGLNDDLMYLTLCQHQRVIMLTQIQ